MVSQIVVAAAVAVVHSVEASPPRKLGYVDVVDSKYATNNRCLQNILDE